MLKLLEDNTVATESENINSCHSHKALTDQTRAIAEAFPYLYATKSGDGEEALTFNGRTINGIGCFDNISGQSERFKLFASLVFTDELRAEVKVEVAQAEADRLAAEEAEAARIQVMVDAGLAKAVANLSPQ